MHQLSVAAEELARCPRPRKGRSSAVPHLASPRFFVDSHRQALADCYGRTRGQSHASYSRAGALEPRADRNILLPDVVAAVAGEAQAMPTLIIAVGAPGTALRSAEPGTLCLEDAW
jgi:hypothetical protein